ncbi:hypothetical protein EV178_002809 [Coemansia sp. RSA 1646]|nr:hypothetical protein EV178_002809 [Coemansia sp. RSA 1646]
MDFSFVTPRRKQKAQARPRLAPMDVDFNDTDDSWLNHPFNQQRAVVESPPPVMSADEHQNKKRLVSTRMEQEQQQEQERQASRTPVFSDRAPFTFTMSPPPPPPPPKIETKKEEPPAAAIEEAVRSNDHQPISPKALRKIYSRRQRQQQQKSRNSLDDDDSQETNGAWMTESEPEEDTRQQTTTLGDNNRRLNQQRTNERIQMHRDLPYVISGYLQLGFNVFMVGTVLIIVVNVLLTIRRDVNSKVQEYSSEILHEIATCSKQYADNQCDPLKRVPAMEPLCVAWESCMHRDPTKVGRAKVSAETLAEIVNGFIDPISFKTMLFFVLLFVGTLLVSNFAFGAYRQNRVQKQYVRRRQHLHIMPPQQQSKRSQIQQQQQPRRRRAAAGTLPPPSTVLS